MNAKKILLLTGGGLAGAAILRYLYRNILLAKQWDYNVDNFSIVQVTPDIKANMYFTIINKSAFKGIVKDIDIKVFTKSNQISQIKQPQVVEIQADGKTSIFVSISAKPSDIFKNWRDILSQVIEKEDLELNFVGNMKLKTPFGWTTIPIRFSTTGKNLYNLYQQYY